MHYANMKICNISKRCRFGLIGGVACRQLDRIQGKIEIYKQQQQQQLLQVIEQKAMHVSDIVRTSGCAISIYNVIRETVLSTSSSLFTPKLVKNKETANMAELSYCFNIWSNHNPVISHHPFLHIMYQKIKDPSINIFTNLSLFL